MTAGAEIDFAEVYESLAAYVAETYGNPMLHNGTANLLRALVSTYPEVFDDIDSDPHAWAARVNAYLYAAAMQLIEPAEEIVI